MSKPMIAITLSLRTEEPLLATSFQGDPNSDVSYPYIPGSMIRGALISHFLKQPGMQNIDLASDPQSRSLFFEDTTRFLNAYPQGEDTQRGLPVPRSLRKDKQDSLSSGESITIYDISHQLGDNGLDDFTLKGLEGEKFCNFSSNIIKFYAVNNRINIHNKRDRQRGRATKNSGQVFRYDAIDSGQKFQSVILTNSEENARELTELLRRNHFLWLGGSQSAGYGKTLVDSIQPYSDSNLWYEVGRSPKQRLNQECLRITLLSDLILRNSCGQYVVDTATVTKALSASLAVPLSPLRSYMGSSFIGGFNRKWGLPLPQVQAIAAGSVFVFEKANLDAERVLALEFEGIGERRNEGFGRVVVNWLEDTRDFDGKKFHKEDFSTNEIRLHNSTSIRLAVLMAERLFRQKLEDQLLEKVSQLRIEGDITNSQLSRLAIIARKALQEDNPQLITQLLDNLPNNTKEKFRRSYFDGNSLDQRLRQWVSAPRCCWTQIELVTIAGETCDLTDELAREYMLRLIMAVCKKAKKERSYEDTTI